MEYINSKQHSERQAEVGWKERNETHCQFEINHLIRHSAHVVVEARPVLSYFRGRKDEIALPLFLAFHNHPVLWADHFIIHIERAAGLDLERGRSVC